jgi:uncharacterized protein (TIGR03067 family)
VKSFRCTFDEKTYNNTINDEVVEEGTFKLDPEKSPKAIDFDIKTGQDKDKKQLGIYKIDGDKLTIVFAKAGSTDRPKSLEPEADTQDGVAVLERVKP